MASVNPVTYQDPHPITCVAAFVHDGQGRILVGRRLTKNSVPGVPDYCLPGGKIDWLETSEAAIIRETKEETGLDIALDNFVHYSDDRWPDLEPSVHCITLYFQARVVGGTLTITEPDKVDQWQWLAPDQVPIPLFANCHLLIPRLTL